MGGCVSAERGEEREGAVVAEGEGKGRRVSAAKLIRIASSRFYIVSRRLVLGKGKGEGEGEGKEGVVAGDLAEVGGKVKEEGEVQEGGEEEKKGRISVAVQLIRSASSKTYTASRRLVLGKAEGKKSEGDGEGEGKEGEGVLAGDVAKVADSEAGEVKKGEEVVLGEKEGVEKVELNGAESEKPAVVKVAKEVKVEESTIDELKDKLAELPETTRTPLPVPTTAVSMETSVKAPKPLKLDAPPGSALARHNVIAMGEGPELLFFSHGFGTNQQIWGNVLEDMDLVNKYRVILWDLMGAYSTNAEGFDFQRYSTLHGYADDLLEVLDELEVEEMTYIGHSVSGMVGVIASTERPEVFKRMILIGASPRYLDTPGYKGGFTLEMLDQVFAAMQDNYKAWASGFAPMVVGEDVDSVAVREFCRSLFLIRPDIAFSTLKTIFTCDMRYIIPQVSKQVHLLQTARDAAVPWEPVQYMLDHLPNACVEMIPVAGHLPHLTHPKVIAEAINRHLDMPIRPLPSSRLHDDESFRSGHSAVSGNFSGRLVGSDELQPAESFEEY